MRRMSVPSVPQISSVEVPIILWKGRQVQVVSGGTRLIDKVQIIVGIVVVVGALLHSGVGLVGDVIVEATVKVAVPVGRRVKPLIGILHTQEIVARVEIEVVMRTLVSHYYHPKNNCINIDVMLHVYLN